MDLFHGQLKSKVTCKVCGHESVRFDPFNYLSLPLPMESYIHVQVIGKVYLPLIIFYMPFHENILFPLKIGCCHVFMNKEKVLKM